jgi:hypothetical protein
MNDLERYFRGNTGKLIHKWDHFFEIYDRHFSRFRGQPVNMLEIGVFQGGSLLMWKDYFGDQANIFGIDINPACKALEEDRVHIFIGDQEDRTFLRAVADSMQRIDIVLDDGGHMMGQLRTAFEELYPRIDPHGVYMAEDLHTCYWSEFGGGYRERASFIEYSKGLIDQLHAWHSKQPNRLATNAFTRSTHSLHYYNSVLAIEKRPIDPPRHSKTGTPALPDYEPPRGAMTPLRRALRALTGR